MTRKKRSYHSPFEFTSRALGFEAEFSATLDFYLDDGVEVEWVSLVGIYHKDGTYHELPEPITVDPDAVPDLYSDAAAELDGGSAVSIDEP